jgi:uncharacterized Zn finger protein (UPF0148 family)
MHGADCPSCETHVELDFKPVSGLVWCPKCQKLFSLVGTELLLEPDEEEMSEERDRKGGDKS